MRSAQIVYGCVVVCVVYTGQKKKEEEEQKRKEQEERERKEKEEAEKKRLAELAAVYDNEDAGTRRERLRYLREEIDDNMIPREYGGSSDIGVVNGHEMYRQLVGLSAQKLRSKWWKKFDSKLPKHMDMESEQKEVLREEKKEKYLRGRDSWVVRWAANRGDKVEWRYNTTEVDSVVVFSLVFHAETRRGKSMKQIVREETEVRCHHYHVYGEYVALQKGKVEFIFKNKKSQRRAQLQYHLKLTRFVERHVDRFLPVVDNEQIQSSYRRSKVHHSARSSNLHRHRRAPSSAKKRPPLRRKKSSNATKISTGAQSHMDLRSDSYVRAFSQ